MNENDIYDLQIKISYLEGFVNDLNGVIITQEKSSSQMKREIVLLKNKIEQLEERIENKGHDVKHDEAPPHY
ncbi:MAG: SlyX family protein [Spirochaetaceae bacterium]|nr:SlyX family protein [Spirochaetaceae bacterium]